MVESPPACKIDVISFEKVVFFFMFSNPKRRKRLESSKFSPPSLRVRNSPHKSAYQVGFLCCLHESAHIIKIFNITNHYSRNLLPDKILLFGNINLYFPPPKYYDHYLQSFEVRNLQNYSRISCLIHIWSLNVDHSFYEMHIIWQ